MKKLIINLLFILISSITLTAQSFENLNCIDLTSTQIKSKMDQLKIGRSDLGGKSDTIIMSYRDYNYGLILCYINKQNKCFKEKIIANYSKEKFLNDSYTFKNCTKIIYRFEYYFIIVFEKNTWKPITFKRLSST